MSATHADATAEPPAAEADDPAIVAEFRRRLLDRYPECDDVSQALAKAEQEPSTTPRHEMPRCPSCATVRISANHTTADGVSWTCTQCRTRFSEPTYSPQTGLDAYGPASRRRWISGGVRR